MHLNPTHYGPISVAFSAAMCQIPCMDVEPGKEDEPIDLTLLDCFMELSLKARIQSAANYANAIERLRRLRPADDSEQAP